MTKSALPVTSSAVWNTFVQHYNLTSQQQDQFEQYVHILLQENEKYNITAIVDINDVVADHFYDSLALLKAYNVAELHRLVDVGSGGGFPGIPLAIMLPHVDIHLVEVNLKKVQFLRMVADQLGLSHVTVHTDDWRTFLRKFDKKTDLFIARASLPVEELLRIFKPSSMHQQSCFVYWASKKWIPNQFEKEYLDNCFQYQVGEKQRQLCFFKKNR